MPSVAYYQHEAVRRMFHVDAAIKDDNFRDAAIDLPRAASYAATAANLHWHIVRSPNSRRKLAYVLLVMSSHDLINGRCVSTFRQLYDLYERVAKAQQAGNRPAARRAVRTSYRRTEHLIRSVNFAIADHPNPAWLPPPEYAQVSTTSTFYAPTSRAKSPARRS